MFSFISDSHLFWDIFLIIFLSWAIDIWIDYNEFLQYSYIWLGKSSFAFVWYYKPPDNFIQFQSESTMLSLEVY